MSKTAENHETSSYTVYPSNGDAPRTFDNRAEAVAWANSLPRYTSVWDNVNDWEELKVW